MAELLDPEKPQNTIRCPLYVQGFTLLEVMVALAILSIALTGVYRLQTQTMAMSAKARFYNLAPLLAQAKLSEIERDQIANIGNGSGEFSGAYPGYSWSLETAQVPMTLLENTAYNLLRIDLTISLNDEATYALRTYRFLAQ